MRRLLALSTIAALSACGGSSDDTGTPSPSATTTPSATPSAPTGGGTVHDLRALAGNRWSVGQLELAVGDSVKVTNADPDLSHNATVAGVGTSPTLQPGATFSLTFRTVGTYQLVCTFHEGMESTVTVR
jgi:plastocyanin